MWIFRRCVYAGPVFSSSGLRLRMAASYVLVSAAAVLVVELVLWAIVVPQLDSANLEAARADHSTGQVKAARLATEVAGRLGEAVSQVGPGLPDHELLQRAARKERPPQSTKSQNSQAQDLKARDLKAQNAEPQDPKAQSTEPGPAADGRSGPGPVSAEPGGKVDYGLRLSGAEQPPPDLVEQVADPAGQVLWDIVNASATAGRLPAGVAGTRPREDTTQVNGWWVSWATNPVVVTTGGHPRVIGVVYVQLIGPDGKDAAAASRTDVGSWLTPGIVVLLLLVPVGVLFGLFSTRGLIRRIRRLAAGTAAMAEGDLRARIPVSGGDEVGRLESGFNSMAERLEAAAIAERAMVDSAARRAEREQIARNLHDSVSQELFSASLLAGWLHRDLPTGTDWRQEAATLETALERTMREMRAMLLELRPVALEDSGLNAALYELCRAYEVRLGIKVTADLAETRLEPVVEHTVLRIVQEALGNAVRHGEPDEISLRLGQADGHVDVQVSDNGRGFDPATVADRHGMGLDLMRDRVNTLSGTFHVVSAPDEGTTITVRLPS
jgi:signal transduction histidine kinase